MARMAASIDLVVIGPLEGWRLPYGPFQGFISALYFNIYEYKC